MRLAFNNFRPPLKANRAVAQENRLWSRRGLAKGKAVNSSVLFSTSPVPAKRFNVPKSEISISRLAEAHALRTVEASLATG